MPTFSRWMPPAPLPSRRSTAVAWAVVAGVLAAGAAALVLWPPARVLLAALVALGVYAGRRLRARLRRLAAGRGGEDIGTFARALDRRASWFDPWVVRAVWDALHPRVSDAAGVPVALRPADRLVEDLGLDPEDLEATVREEVCTRVGRDMDADAGHPPAVVATVGDLARYVAGLPRRAAI